MRITAADIAFDKSVRIGHTRACRELEDTPRHLLNEGNPNHPNYDLHLFGERAEKFMARQHRN